MGMLELFEKAPQKQAGKDLGRSQDGVLSSPSCCGLEAGVGGGQASRSPGPEVVAKAVWCHFTAEHRLRILSRKRNTAQDSARSDGCFVVKAFVPCICRQGLTAKERVISG